MGFGCSWALNDICKKLLSFIFFISNNLEYLKFCWSLWFVRGGLLLITMSAWVGAGTELFLFDKLLGSKDSIGEFMVIFEEVRNFM